MMKTILSLNDLVIGFDDIIILKDIHTELYEKNLVALMGENGIGKSCLLQSIVGLIPVISGEVTILNKSLKSYSSIELAQTVAVVLTEKVHIDFIKVFELISLGRSPYLNSSGVLNKKDEKLVSDAIELLKIDTLRDCYFSDLSDGQKQKVMIARALAQDPKILILDEPTTHLDIPSRIELMKILRNIIQQKNISIILSSHDAELVLEFADAIWYINHAGILQIESPDNASKLFFKFERESVR